MATDVEATAQVNDRRVLGALLFIAACTNVVDVYSALNSSPWTAQSFGGDPEKARACMKYVYHSMIVASGFSIAASVIARSWWPLAGAVLAEGYMYYLYRDALKKAQEKGSTSWGDGGA